MNKKKKGLSNIQTNHTLGEYQRYFSHLLAKGKLKRFSLGEKNKLNPKRQYWKITNEKGETYYYELPRYIKPNSNKTAYSMKRVMHRRPARAAIIIFAGTALLSFTSAIVIKRFMNQNVPPQPYDPTELKEQLEKFITWKNTHPGEDVTKSPDFTISDLSMVSMANALYDPTTTNDDDFARRPLLAIGSGHTLSIGIIEVNVTNAFIYNESGDALEESISCSDSRSSLVPHVGRRDFYSEADNEVNSNSGVATSATKATWSNQFDKHFTKEDYIETVGKIPDNPFLYSIDNETVLKGSSATKVGDEYHIHIELDTLKGVARYKKRMTYLSGKTATYFYFVRLDFVTDLDLRPISFSVEERYDVDYMFKTDGVMTTKFFYDVVPSVPEDKTTPFNYDPYLPF